MMMVMSFRMQWNRILVAAGCLLLLAVGMIFWWQYPPEVAQVFGRSKAEVKCATDEERVAYLEEAGWQVDPEPVGALEVVIPQEFDAVYESYAMMQERQGFHLDRYKGDTAQKFTYRVTNYPGGEEVLANLLIYKNRVIAADLCSAQLGGFIQGLKDAAVSDE